MMTLRRFAAALPHLQSTPGVGREWIRRLLSDMKKRGEVTWTGKGPAARWSVVRSEGTTLK
jgi:hypothetical protein